MLKQSLITLSFLSLFILSSTVPSSDALTSASASCIAYWQNTGNDHIEIGTSSQKLIINITQFTNDGAIYNIAFSSSNNRTIFQPAANFNTLYFTTNGTFTEDATVSNSFGQERVENLPITIKITNILTQETIGSLTVYATLLPMQEETPQPSGSQTTQPTATETNFTQPGINTNDLVTYLIVFVVAAVLVILLLVIILRRSNKKKLLGL